MSHALTSRRRVHRPGDLAAHPTRALRPLASLGDAATATADERERFGNKAWRLGNLSRAGLPVPDGFCIADDAFAGDDLPPALADAVRSAWRRLGAPIVAVRSSAVDEDLAERSAAGLYTSVLNVRGEAALLAAIRSCRSARVGGRAPAVLVQRQVDADAAGVLFTRDPLSGEADRLVVNAVPGLGEPLASGRVDGDTFHLAPCGTLIASQIRSKTAMLTPTGERPVPPGRRRRPVLTGPQLRRLAGLARAVAAAAREPQGLDIEFALVGTTPLLLQARPIPKYPPPKLPPPARVQPAAPAADSPLAAYLGAERARFAARADRLRTGGRVRADDVVFSSGNIGELLPTPTRFSFGLFRRLFAGDRTREGAIARGRRRLGYPLPPHATDELFELIAGQPYFNLEIDAMSFDIGIAPQAGALLAAVVAEPAAASYPELALYPRLIAAQPGGPEATLAFDANLAQQAERQRRRFARLLERLDRDAATGAATPTIPGDERAQIAALGDEIAWLQMLAERFVVAARLGFHFAGKLRTALQSHCGDRQAFERRYARLLQGLDGSRITRQSLDLGRLADGRLSREDFLARHGHLADVELEVDGPRLSEAPERLAALLAGLAGGGRSPEAAFAHQRAQRRRAEDALARVFAGERKIASRAAFFADLRAAQHYLPLRESLKDHIAAGIARLRRRLLALSATIGWPEETLFALEPDEILALPEQPEARAAWRLTADARRDERALAARLARECPLPPVLFGSRPEAIGSPPAASAEDRAGHLATPIAPGVAEGPVRVLLGDKADEETRPGEILVAPSANLGLAPRFRSAAGVVVEVGGVLAHCACQAREAGIPAVVLAGATRFFADGDLVRIDAGNGRVTLLARARQGQEVCGP